MHPFLASLEDYLPILLFFAIWWIVVKKLKRLGRQPPKATTPTAERTGEEFNLQKALQQVLGGQVKMPRSGNRGAQPGPRPLPPPVPPTGEATHRLSLEEKEENGPVADMEPAFDKKRPQPAKTPATPNRSPISPPQEVPSVIYAARTISGRELRRAVVWSEILGPPVSLRE